MQKIFKLGKWLPLVLLVAMIVVYTYSILSLQALDDEARISIGGEFLPTSQGILSYSREGRQDAPVVVLVHGFSTPKFVWSRVSRHLTDAGYQVVSFDHFGRGFSDRPNVTYNAQLYRRELQDLIAGLDLATPVRLVGYSMGGANVVDYAAQYPQQVKQLVLIAPAGYMAQSASITPLGVPILGKFLATVFGKGYARESIAAEVAAGRADATMLTQFDEQANYSGYTNSLLSTLLNYPMANRADRYKQVGASGIPVTAIWGTEDKIVPYAGAARMREDVPQLKLITLEGANHNLTYATHDVGPAVLSALNSVP